MRATWRFRSTKVFWQFVKVRYHWPYDWNPILPCPVFTCVRTGHAWSNVEGLYVGVGLVWLYWRVSVMCRWEWSVKRKGEGP